MSYAGKTERHLINTECQEDRLDDLHDKDFVKQTTIGQTQRFFDKQRQEKPTPEEHLTI